MTTRLLPAGLVLAALSLLVIGPVAGEGFSLRPGALMRAVGFGALVASAMVAVHRLAPRHLSEGREGSRHRDWTRPAQIAGLLVLCAIGAELLAAYSDNTGDPAGIAFALIFFGALYGAPALLVRDLARRRGWGWPSMLLLFAALGVAQACLIDQSLFSTHYQGYEGWEETREATLIPALGLSAFSAYNFILGHVIFSFGAPVAIAEGWRPERARKPWLGVVGTVVAALLYVGAGALILSDPESRSGSTMQLSAAAGVVGILVIGAVLVGSRPSRSRPATDGDSWPQHPLPVWATLVLALLAGLLSSFVGETWVGFFVGTVLTCAVGIAVLTASKKPGWSTRHVAAVALGFLLARGLLAFTYYPLIGEVSAGPKYLHNTVMILVVAFAGWLAVRPPHGVGGPR